MSNKQSGALFTAIFLILIFPLGILSLINLVRSTVQDEVINNEWTEDMGNKFESDIAATFFGKDAFINLNGSLRTLFGQREMNGVVKLSSGWLTAPLERCPDDRITQFTSRTAAFKRYLENRGTALLYVSPPYTGSKFDPQLPAGVEDYSNDNIDRLLLSLNAAGIDTLDIREALHRDQIDEYQMMYRTDHHWTTEAGFYTYGLLEKYIVEKTGCETDLRVSDPEFYTVSDYGKWLGSRGQRTGVSFAGTDSFTMFEPKFETRIRNEADETGSISDFFLITDPVRNPNRVETYIYDDVLGGGNYIGHYTNLNSPNDVRLLIISDSFAKAVNPYLIMGFREVDSFYDSFVCDITPQVIEAYDPDVVIMLYYPQYINSDSGSFDFCGY